MFDHCLLVDDCVAQLALLLCYFTRAFYFSFDMCCVALTIITTVSEFGPQAGLSVVNGGDAE